MMSRKKKVAMGTLPILFFGYAMFANVAMMSGAADLGVQEPKSLGAVLNGSVTSRIDTLYKTSLPHRDPAIGLVGVLRYLVLHEGRKGVVVGAGNWLFSDEEFRPLPAQAQVLDDSARRIAEIRDRLAVMGSRLVVVPLPAKADIYRDHLGNDEIASGLAARYAALLKALASRSVETVDARAALLSASKHQQVFLETDTHWTPAGASVVANRIAETEPTFGRTRTYTIQSNQPVEVLGDLTKFIASGPYFALTGIKPEKVTLRQAVQAEPQNGEAVSDLFGTETAIPAVLVGTSYSANETWGFAEDLKAALGVDVLNVAELGRGPVFPMKKYLESDTLRNSPPKLVIWEFPVRYLALDDLWNSMPGSVPLETRSVKAELKQKAAGSPL
ncbi:alginate O-acetyltransferase [soil metagenome]